MQSSQNAEQGPVLRKLRRGLRHIERGLERGLKSEEGPGCCGIGLAQCHALLAIPEDGAELSTLSRELGVEASTLTRTLDSLDKARLIRRWADPEDRRRGRVELSPEGLTKVGQIDEAWNHWLASVLEKIPKDKQGTVLEGITLLAQALAKP